MKQALCAALILAAILTSACLPELAPAPPPSESAEPPVQLPNPASQNCLDQGGTLSLERRPDGGEYRLSRDADDSHA